MADSVPPPLHHIRILVTRARHQASALADELTSLGATPILIPTIEIAPPESFDPLDDAIADLKAYDWLIFTSANAVEVFAERCRILGLPSTENSLRMPPLRRLKVATIGPSTARALHSIGMKPDLIPPTAIAESLAGALLETFVDCNPPRCLLVRAAEARDVLPESLRSAGAKVEIVAAYRNVIPADSIEALWQIFSHRSTYPDAITFTSASTVRNLLALVEAAGLNLPRTILRASIGPVTSATLREAGYPADVEAPEASIPSLAQALAEHFSGT